MPDEADVMIVNTCSFIDAAKEESIGAILEANQRPRDAPPPPRAEADRGRLHGAAFRRRIAHARCPRSTPSSAWTSSRRSRRSSRGCWRRSAEADAAGKFRHAAAALHSRFRHAALPAHAVAHRLRQDRRGLQPSLLLLHHPADARTASQPHGRFDRGRGARGSWPRA